MKILFVVKLMMPNFYNCFVAIKRDILICILYYVASFINSEFHTRIRNHN